jgi:prepilin-type N-terminal cleavage/methylation domain-containing protein
MKPMPSRRGGRPAFTLVELLVVIAIISILVALTAAAVFGVFSRGTETTTKVELDQLTSAVNVVKSKYGLKYLPSRIVLREDNNYDPNPTTNPTLYLEHQRTIKFLQQMFPKINLKPHVLPADPYIDWNGDGKMEPATGGDDGKGNFILYGDQALVFFLGGIPSNALTTTTNACLGFSTNPANPADPTAGTRDGPFFDFVSSRLNRSPVPISAKVTSNNQFFRYFDQWKNTPPMPYLYFSTYGSDNSYHVPSGTDTYADCPPWLSLLPTVPTPVIVTPYAESATPAPGIFTNRSSFQIISAGKDGVFGPGGLWTPSKGAKTASGQPLDDQANFGGAVLGAAVK